MALNMQGFDRSRRTLIFNMRPLPREIGGISLAPQQNDKYPELMPYSRVVDTDGVVYYETNSFESKYNSAGIVADEKFMPPFWAEVEAVEFHGRTQVKDVKSPSGTTRAVPEEIVLHEFNAA